MFELYPAQHSVSSSLGNPSFTLTPPALALCSLWRSGQTQNQRMGGTERQLLLQAETAANIRRALLPANSLASWVIVGAAVIGSLRLVGLDPSPLLTLGSVSGIVVGFASQALLLNLVSGVSIFITRCA